MAKAPRKTTTEQPAEAAAHDPAPALPWTRNIKLSGNGTPWSQTDAFVDDTGKVACHVLHDGGAAGIAASSALLRGANGLAEIKNLIMLMDLRTTAENGEQREAAPEDVAVLLSRIRDIVGVPELEVGPGPGPAFDDPNAR